MTRWKVLYFLFGCWFLFLAEELTFAKPEIWIPPLETGRLSLIGVMLLSAWFAWRQLWRLWKSERKRAAKINDETPRSG